MSRIELAMASSKRQFRRVVFHLVLYLQLVKMSSGQQPVCTSCSEGEKNTWFVDPGSPVSCTFNANQWSPATGYFCNFTQSCTQAGAGVWQQKSEYKEISGAGSDYSAYATLQSPGLHVRQASCLSFHFAQTLPSKLVVIANSTCIFRADDKQQNQFQPGLVSLPPGNTTIEFRAYNLAQPDTWVRLKNVTLWEGKCPEIALVVGFLVTVAVEEQYMFTVISIDIYNNPFLRIKPVCFSVWPRDLDSSLTSPHSTAQSGSATCSLVSLKIIVTASLSLYLYIFLSQ